MYNYGLRIYYVVGTSQVQADLPTPRPHKRSPLWLDVGYPGVPAVTGGIHVVNTVRHKEGSLPLIKKIFSLGHGLV